MSGERIVVLQVRSEDPFAIQIPGCPVYVHPGDNQTCLWQVPQSLAGEVLALCVRPKVEVVISNEDS